jgi:hypothetical protein
VSGRRVDYDWPIREKGVAIKFGFSEHHLYQVFLFITASAACCLGLIVGRKQLRAPR